MAIPPHLIDRVSSFQLFTHCRTTELNGSLQIIAPGVPFGFVPTKNFLTRTLGFFQDPQIALVQTPQSFYNPDPIARNLGLENILLQKDEG